MPGTDDIRRLSDELAREPGSLVVIPLAELLLAAGDLDAAWSLIERCSQRHRSNVPVHTLLARLAAKREQWDAALAAWERVALLAVGTVDAARARQAQAFQCFRLGRFADADRYLDAAAAAGGNPAAISAARMRVRGRLGDPSGRTLFDELLEPGDLTALLIATDGSVAAGRFEAADGRDVSREVAAELAGVGDEATRAMRHLALGNWQTIVVEATRAVVALTPAAGGVALVATASSTPLGRIRRLLDRVGARARDWRAAA